MFKAIFGIAIGIIILIGSVIYFFHMLDFVNSSMVTPGMVVNLNAGGSHPQIAFTTIAGKHVSYPQGGLIFGMKVGDKVDVRYLLDAPVQTATLDRFSTIWGEVIALALASLFFIYCGWANLPSRKTHLKSE